MIHDGPFGASFWGLCSVCRVLKASHIVWRIGVVSLYYTIAFYRRLYYAITVNTNFLNDFNDLAWPKGLYWFYYTIRYGFNV